MILQHNINGLIWYELNCGCYCLIAFTLSELINQLPNEFKNLVLTQLN